MTEHATPGADDAAAEAPATATAGTILAQAREASGLSVDDVSMQLKLAPRQVVAIERDDFASLPGRTFIRGFVRNYARLLKLDVDAVLAALPGLGAAPAPDRPQLAAPARAIGELPREPAPRPGAARWAIPLVLVAIVAVAAFYEFARPPVTSKAPAAASVDVAPAPLPAPATPATTPGPATEPTSAATPAGDPPATAAPPSSTELPNPLANAAPPTGDTAVAAGVPAAEAAPATPATASASGVIRNQLGLTFRGISWIEVRDRTGSVVLSMTGAGGSTRELAVAPPGEVVIGNAAVVDASWRGKPIDLAPHTRQNVARVRLD